MKKTKKLTALFLALAFALSSCTASETFKLTYHDGTTETITCERHTWVARAGGITFLCGDDIYFVRSVEKVDEK